MPKGDEKMPKGIFSQFLSRLGWFNEGSGPVLFFKRRRKRTSEDIRPPPQNDEWGRLNRQSRSEGDQKVTKSVFSGSIIVEKAVYWPLFGHFPARFWPALAKTKGKTRHFWPGPAQKVSRNMIGTGPRGPVPRSQTKQRVFCQNPSRTLFWGQEKRSRRPFGPPRRVRLFA